MKPQHQYLFPSVIERNDNDLSGVAESLIDGLRVVHNGDHYIVGQLALSEGKAPHRAINARPDEIDYQLLLKSALLLALQEASGPLSIAIGFPYATFQANRQMAERIVTDMGLIDYDCSPFSGNGLKELNATIDKVTVVPEAQACLHAYRHLSGDERGSHFIASLGYGTFEACLATASGPVQRTMISTSGIRYAVDLLSNDLMKEHFLGLRTEQQIDRALREASIVLNRRRIDLSQMRKDVLRTYYNDVISPAMRNAWTDEDFDRGRSIVLAGGGTCYDDLVECFEEEFDGLIKITRPEDAKSYASYGYWTVAQQAAAETGAYPVGIDVGNAQTIIVAGVQEGGTISSSGAGSSSSGSEEPILKKVARNEPLGQSKSGEDSWSPEGANGDASGDSQGSKMKPKSPQAGGGGEKGDIPTLKITTISEGAASSAGEKRGSRG